MNREVAPATYDLQTTYTYDDAGNPTSAVDAPTTGPGETQCFTYDGLRRLTNAWTPASGDCATPPSSTSLGGPAPYGFTDTFDTIGNRTARTTYAAAGNTTHTYTYPAAGTDGAHTLTSVTATGPAGTTTNTYNYDDAGNTTSRTVAGTPAQNLTWDAEGELASLAEAGGATDSYLYTADGDRLIRRQDGAATVYLPGGMELTLAAGQVKATRYYSFNGQTIAVRTGSTSAGVWTLIPDRHGTAQLAIQNSTSTVTRKYTDPYGNPRGTAPTTWTGDHGYLDKPTDTTGLTQIGARYYDPAIARFISVDPIMDLIDPQQWHGYAYANNNPITWSDPTGLAPTIDGQWGSARAAGAAKTGKYVPGSKQHEVRSVHRTVPVTIVGLYFTAQDASTRAAWDMVKGVWEGLPPVAAYNCADYWRNDFGRDWAEIQSTPGGYWSWASDRVSGAWNSARDTLTAPWRNGDVYGMVDQVAYAGTMVGLTVAGGKAVPARPGPATNVIVDTNAVYNKSGVLGALNMGEVPVVTGTTRAEIANLAAAGRMKPPGFAGELGTIPDIMDVNLRINIRTQLAELRPGQPGLFGDGAIGATAVRSGSPVITADKTFGNVLRSFGVDVRRP